MYLRDLSDGFEAERVVGDWFSFYNTSARTRRWAAGTPAEAYGRAAPP